MKTILYTCTDKNYLPLAQLTVPRLADYAERHGMDFTCYDGPMPNSCSPNEGIYWLKFEAALELFNEGYERLIWMDVDQLVTNIDYVLPETKTGLHLPKDWGYDAVESWHLSVCGFIAHPNAIPLFKTAIYFEPEWRGQPFPEQGPLREVVKRANDSLTFVPNKEQYEGLINIHPKKPFNSVPDDICPGKVPEPWVKTDWCAHLTMLPVSDRVALAKKILSGA